jgi:hypothetical protein
MTPEERLEANALAELLVTGQILGMLNIKMGQPVSPVSDTNGHYRNQLIYSHDLGDFIITVEKKGADERPRP